jgi:hypothetical protein
MSNLMLVLALDLYTCLLTFHLQYNEGNVGVTIRLTPHIAVMLRSLLVPAIQTALGTAVNCGM